MIIVHLTRLDTISMLYAIDIADHVIEEGTLRGELLALLLDEVHRFHLQSFPQLASDLALLSLMELVAEARYPHD